MKSLKKWNMWLSIIHGILAIFLMIFFFYVNKKSEKPPELDLRLFDFRYEASGTEIDQMNVVAEKVLDVPVITLETLMVLFFLITSIFHMFYSYSDKYLKSVKNKNNYYRWIEYSITATIMIVIIALSSGIKSYDTMIMLIAASIAIMLQGDQVEKQLRNSKGHWIGPMFVGFMLNIAIFYVIIRQFNNVIEDVNNFADIPTWLFLVVYVLAFFYSVFGIVALVMALKGGSYICYEKTYLILSLLAKTSLGVFVAYGFGQRLMGPD